MRAIDELSISVSKGEDAKVLAERVTPLLKSEAEGGKWQLTPTSDGLTRMFRFKTFKRTGKDVEMAEFCDETAREFGEVEEGEAKGCGDFGEGKAGAEQK
ncbi:hypothetical protein B0A48_06777 [Cryoendolithus antarcticus]|uniref:4a-hydroxytetrahydrobiopterin dehydratase n=1 Tax=Cryoendolithus antarcticus TaxID=1507870 RepID=A0A1V8T9N5_9PEZI|nr:hypothetical protein B0A48_06777 [Cryoendolithus antarcticus]